MKIEDILFKIRRRETPFYASVKSLLVKIMEFNLPAPKILFRPLYELLVLWRYLGHYIIEKLIYVPIFKSRCEECGKALSLPNGIPWIEGNLVIRIGDNVVLDDTILLSGRIYEQPTLEIGDRAFIGCKTTITVGQSVKIGKDCMIAAQCFIADNDGHPLNPFRRANKEPVKVEEIKPVVIEDNVWIGTRAVILKGVNIGKGSILSANSVVTRNIPPYSIVMGNPAKIVMSQIDRIYKKEKE